MNESAKYSLRWRGRESGPFSVDEINRKLDDHEIGLGHEIKYEDRWISVETFFEELKSKAGQPPASPKPTVVPPASVDAVASRPPTVTPPQRMASPLPVALLTETGPADQKNARPRRRLIYATLAILLGFTGIHNFYARHWLTGVVQVLISVASSFLGFGLILPWIWAMVEAVLVRRDGNDLEML